MRVVVVVVDDVVTVFRVSSLSVIELCSVDEPFWREVVNASDWSCTNLILPTGSSMLDWGFRGSRAAAIFVS